MEPNLRTGPGSIQNVPPPQHWSFPQVTKKVKLVLTCDHRMADDVSADVLSPDARLHDGHIHPLPPEHVVGQDGHELEVGRPVVGGPTTTNLHNISHNINTRTCGVNQWPGVQWVGLCWQIVHLGFKTFKIVFPLRAHFFSSLKNVKNSIL